MTIIDSFGKDYLRLVLEIHAHHIDGYVDAYYGPPEIKHEVESNGPEKPAALLSRVVDLQTRIPTADPARHAYLSATLRAIECTIRMLNDEDIDYLDEVSRLYDIQPQLVDESRFEAAHRALDQVLPTNPADKSLEARLQSWQKTFEIQTEQALPLLELARSETRTRTSNLVTLPPGESVEVKLVKGQPWSAYNWYLGRGRSLIEFNTDMPLHADRLLDTFAHEGYPGHHTEAILKEQILYKAKGYTEQSAMLLHSPAAVIAEGIAVCALEMIFPGDSHLDWNAGVMFPAAGISFPTEAVDQMRQIRKAAKDLRYVNGNGAILYHTGQLNQEKTIDYFRSYGLMTAERAAKSFGFISYPLYRSYIFTYTAGHDLIRGTADPAATFRELLTGQILPSQLVANNQQD